VTVYKDFYGLRENPFQITPDPRFLYMAPSHRKALDYLEYGIRDRKGLLVLVGEVGTGKTLLIRTLLQRLDAHTETALVMNARLGFKQLLYMALRDWNLQVKGRTKMDLLLTLQDFLVQVRNRQGNAALIVDEAQNLSPVTLEGFRLLSNLETSTQKLLQIIFVGQPELEAILNRHDLRQLRQRIPGISRISHLNPQEVAAYVRHRLRVAGFSSPSGWIFEDGALLEISRFSGGIPRVINLICDRALTLGYLLHLECIDGGTIRQAHEDLQSGRMEAVGGGAQP
jgi:general secretion pathway protein A